MKTLLSKINESLIMSKADLLHATKSSSFKQNSEPSSDLMTIFENSFINSSCKYGRRENVITFAGFLIHVPN